MNESIAQTMHRRFNAEVATLVRAALADKVSQDRALVERFVRLADALQEIIDQHDIDGLGRCRSCRPSENRLWVWHRSQCRVHDALALHLAGHRRDK